MTRLRIAQIAVGVLVVVWGIDQLVTTPGETSADQNQVSPGTVAAAGTGAPVPNGVRPVTNENSVPVVPHAGGRCKAFAPADWQVLPASERGDLGELASADRRSYASWGVYGVNRAQEPYHGPLYGDPMTSSRFLLGHVAAGLGDRGVMEPVGSPARFGDGYVAQEFRSSTNRGLIVYREYPAPGPYAPGSYVNSLRMAIAPLDAGDFALKIAAGVAASIDCNTMFVPPADNQVRIPDPNDARTRRRRGEPDELEGYNVQLGTQTFHSPTTGENFIVDRATGLTNGPDGEGAYRRSGNSYERLVPGRAP